MLKTLGAVSVSTAVLAFSATVVGAVGFNAIQTANNTFSSGTLQLEGTTGATNCFSTGTGSGNTVAVANAQPCSSGSPIPTGQLSNTASSSATTTLTSVGKVNGTSSVTASASCGVAQLSDATSATDWSGTGPNTALPFYGVTYQAGGPLSTQAITTDGSTGWAETTKQYTNPETFTVLVWFKTTSAQGAITGFASSQNPIATAPTSHDRQLWIDSSGKLVWGVNSSSKYEIASTSAVNTGNWVFAAASVGAAGMALYVNGTSVATASTHTSASSYSGWWSMGYAYLASWSDIPTSYYFNGSIAQLAIIPSQLSSAQVSTLYADNTLSTYTAGVNGLSPANYWALNDSGSVPYEGSVPSATASTTLVDASGNSDTGTAQDGVTLGATGPTTPGGAIQLNGSTGYVQTAKSYANPEGISEVAWFKTTSASGGTILGFTSSQTNATPTYYDRTIWMDNSGKLVYEVTNGSTAEEVTSTSAYNDGNWHMVVAEIGSGGQLLWVDGAFVYAGITVAESYTGYWHLGWGYETGQADAPTSPYLNGSLSQVAIIPSTLNGAEMSLLHNVPTAGAYAGDLGQLVSSTSASYWPLFDSATAVCGTTEITIQYTQGSTNTCVYPAGSGACPALSSTYKLSTLGVRSSSVVPTSSSAVTVTINMELSVASGTSVKGLHMLPDIAFGTSLPSTPLWSALVSYPYASVEL
jgi:hypothetical protein